MLRVGCTSSQLAPQPTRSTSSSSGIKGESSACLETPDTRSPVPPGRNKKNRHGRRDLACLAWNESAPAFALPAPTDLPPINRSIVRAQPRATTLTTLIYPLLSLSACTSAIGLAAIASRHVSAPQLSSIGASVAASLSERVCTCALVQLACSRSEQLHRSSLTESEGRRSYRGESNIW